MLHKISIVILIIALATTHGVVSWKPITGQSNSGTFTIHQSHPSNGGSSASLHHHGSNLISNGLISSSSSNNLALSSIEHSNLGFLGDHNLAQALTTGPNDDYKGFESENGRLFSSSAGIFAEDACSVDKYAFDTEGTIHYRNKLPKLNQFTICYWMRFTNHSGDHTLFTYSVDDEPREIQMWIANSKGSSYISMAIRGQQIYRLNYPLKVRKWHHSCSSWNGKTGEWQLWIKAERVGRGFHNRLVGHDIGPNGILFSGGPSITGPTTEGLHFEMTLLQIYKVALTAGKAHRDHKHHHVHHFDHEGPAASTTPAPRAPMPGGLPVNPRLANGQIPTQVRINLAGQQQQQPAPQSSIQGVPSQVLGGSFANQQATINTNFINGQFHTGSRFIAQQLAPTVYQQQNGLLPSRTQSSLSNSQLTVAPLGFPGQSSGQFTSSSNAQFIDNSGTQRFLFKRNDNNQPTVSKQVIKRETPKNKRGLVMLGDGSLVDDTLLAHGYQFEGLAKFGLPAFKQGLESKMSIEDEIKEHDKEPAEEEVKAVMGLCTSCDSEPFKGAIVLAWKEARAAQEGTLKGRSVGGCGYF